MDFSTRSSLIPPLHGERTDLLVGHGTSAPEVPRLIHDNHQWIVIQVIMPQPSLDLG